jgi:hypothetical protein
MERDAICPERHTHHKFNFHRQLDSKSICNSEFGKCFPKAANIGPTGLLLVLAFIVLSLSPQAIRFVQSSSSTLYFFYLTIQTQSPLTPLL